MTRRLHVVACKSSLGSDMAYASLAVQRKKQEPELPLLCSSHTNKKRVCVCIKISQASDSRFYNEKSSRAVQLKKMCVSVTVTQLSASQSEAAD